MTRPVKVVQMTTVHHPEDPRIYYKQCCSLAEAGFDVSYIAPKVDDVRLDRENLTYIPIQKSKKRFLSMLISPLRAYRMAKKLDPDIIHIHDPELLLVGKLLTMKGFHVIYDIHEDYQTGIVTRDYFNLLVRKGLSRLYKWIENAVTKDMTLIIAEKYYQEIYPSGIPILNYPITDDQLLSRRITESEISKKVIYTGNITKDRGALNHAVLVHADAELEVHMIGKCDKQLAKAMQAVAVPAEDRLYIDGVGTFVSRERIMNRYTEENWLAGIALLPASAHYEKKELTKFFEYMLAGIPIICSNFPVWQAFVEKYECGITVDPDNPVAFQKALNQLQRDPQKAAQMGRNGRHAVLNELNWSKEAEKLKEIYDGLLSGERL